MSNLQLSIYTFVLKEKGKNSDSEFIDFGAFFRANFIKKTDPVEIRRKPETLYKYFMGDFISSFHNEFKLNENKTRAIGADEKYIKLSPSKNLIEGVINGGATGIDQSIYDRKDMKKNESVLGKGKVATLPYYYKIWTPYNSNVGVVMIQSYTDFSVSGLIINHIKEVFKKYNAAFKYERHITKELKEKFLKKSKIYKVGFIKNKLSKGAREKFNPIFSDHEGLKIKITVEGFNESPEGFLNRFKSNNHIIGSNLRDLEIENDEDVDATVYYKDHDNRRAHAKITSGFDIKPTYFLDDRLKEEGTDYPSFEKISEFTNGVLEVVKKEIMYTP